MNIDQLKYLTDLAITNSMNLTAKRMFITQQAVSDSIKRLEQELGCTLLNRSKTGISFTEDGKVILEHAQKILNHHYDIEHYLQEKYNKNYYTEEKKHLSTYLNEWVENEEKNPTYPNIKFKKWTTDTTTLPTFQ